MRPPWLSLVLVGLALLCVSGQRSGTVEVPEGEHQIVINEVVIKTSADFFAAGADGDWVEASAQVSYTVTLPNGTQVEHPSGGSLPYVVKLTYEWTWVANAADFDCASADLVDTEYVADNHYRVRFLQPGAYTTKVHVTATVEPAP